MLSRRIVPTALISEDGEAEGEIDKEALTD
jgi:hypothetical protein